MMWSSSRHLAKWLKTIASTPPARDPEVAVANGRVDFFPNLPSRFLGVAGIPLTHTDTTWWLRAFLEEVCLLRGVAP